MDLFGTDAPQVAESKGIPELAVIVALEEGLGLRHDGRDSESGIAEED